MADVQVEIRAEISDLQKKLKAAEKKLAGFSKKSKQAGDSIVTAGKKSRFASLEIGKLASKFSQGLGIGAAVGGLKIFGATVDTVMDRARRQAALTQATFEAAFGSTVKFDVPIETFTIGERSSAVSLGREAQAKLNDVRKQLENNFSRFINVDAISGGIERALTAASLLGLGEEQLGILKTLKEQEARLEAQVQKYTVISQQLVEANKLAKQLKERGLSPDKKNLTQTDFRNAFFSSPAPIFGDIINDRSAQFRLLDGKKSSDFIGQNNPQSLAKALPDADDVGRLADEFDEFASSLLNTQRAVKAGVIPAMTGMRNEAGLLEQRLISMLEQGISPASAEFSALQERLGKLQGQIALMDEQLSGSTSAFQVLSSVGNIALSGIAFKFEEATSAGAKFRNTLRSIGNKLLDIGINAGISFGAGALLGSPLSFGDVLKGSLGIGSVASTSSAVSGANISGSARNIVRAPKQQLEVVGFRMGGGDLLLTLQEAQNTRGVGGVVLQ